MLAVLAFIGTITGIQTAQASFLFGLNGTYGLSQPSSEFVKTIGGTATSGQGGIGSNTTVYRDFGTSLKGIGYGATFGFLGKKWGVDLRGRRATASGVVNKYTRATSNVSITAGTVDYTALMIDVGFRWYFKRWFFVRPHVGQVYDATYKYAFTTNPKTDSDSEGKARLAYGAGAAIVLGGGKLRLEIGADYTRYGSSFGGTAQEMVIAISPTFYFAQKTSSSSKK